MTLITAAENIIGPIENWPSHILEYLFCEIPNPDALKELTAFFYGNGVPCPMASQLCHACNPKTTATVTDYLYKKYSDWDCSMFETHLARYYNMRFKKYMYINGSCRDHYEPADSFLTQNIKLGIGNTPFPSVIRCWLDGIRSVPYY